MEGEFKRGDVYWLKDRDSVGSEERLRRPVVIVSSDKANGTSPMVTAASMTTKMRYGIINVPVNIRGRQSWVLCNQVNCWDKVRLDQYICTVTEAEMAEIDKGLRYALSLNNYRDDDDGEDENRCFREEIESLNRQIADRKDSDTGVVVERDMWKRMYEKAIEMLAEVQLPKAEPKVVEEKVAPKVEKVVDPDPDLEPVDINLCTRGDLMKLGLSSDMVSAIFKHRPYKTVNDLRSVPGMNSALFNTLKNRIDCIPVIKKEPKVVGDKKVNMNTATAKEIVEGTGICESTARQIVSYRKKVGRFDTIEDLEIVPRVGPLTIKRFREKMEV